MKPSIPKSYCLCVLLVLALLCTGCAGGQTAAPEDTSAPAVTEAAVQAPSPALKLSVVVDETNQENDVLLSEVTDHSFQEISLYFGLSAATWEDGTQTLWLRDALAQGLVTPEEMACYARLDAENGFCTETYETENGLTNFTYAYPTFNLRIVYDVYCTPNNGDYLIDYLVIYPQNSDSILSPITRFYLPSGEAVDREDWGLDFTVEESSATGITLRCAQSGGQQIGRLYVHFYNLRHYNLRDTETETGLETATGESPECGTDLNMGGETLWTLDWTEAYGALPAGQYALNLYIYDIYEESQMHPLMQNFYDWQVYTLEFTIS